MVEIGSLSTLCFFRLSFGNAIIQEGTSHPEDTSTFAIFLKNGLSSSVKNVMASPDLPALPHRPTQMKIDMKGLSVTRNLHQMHKCKQPMVSKTIVTADKLNGAHLYQIRIQLKKEPNRQVDEVHSTGN